MPFKDLEEKKKWNHAWYIANKARLSAKSQKYYADNKEEIKERSTEWYIANLEKARQTRQEYYQRNKDKIKRKTYPKAPKKQRAQNAINNRISRGKLVRPDKCEFCNTMCKPHGHHPDYNQELHVVWLCAKCHVGLHTRKY